MLSSANRRSSFVRSLSSIHHPPQADDFLPRESLVSKSHDNNAALDERDRRTRSNILRKNGIKTHKRRDSFLASSVRTVSGATNSPTSSVAIRPPHFGSLPTLPFSKGEQRSRCREKSQEHPARKQFQRRGSTLLTAETAHEFMVKFMSETPKQHHRRQGQQRRRCSMDDGFTDSDRKVRFESTNKPPTRRRASVDVVPQQTQEEYQYGGFRNYYFLGETIKSSSHMIIEPTAERSVQAVNTLQKHDFAFIKRSDGSYSYAILACRSFKQVKGAKNKATAEEHMTFVMNDIGSTKEIRRCYWSDNVHLVSMKGLSPHRQTVADMGPVLVCQEIEDNNDDWVPPSMISCIPQEDCGDEDSVISSVSDRARMQDWARYSTL